MKTTAKRDGGDWVINGAKMWITNGNVAQIAIVWAQTEDGIQGFIVPTDTPGFTAQEIRKKMSLRASVTSALFFDNVRVSDAQSRKIGRASGRERVCRYVSFSVVAVSLQKKEKTA